MRERFEIKFDDFTNLVVYKWHNPEIKKIGCVQIAHGINEHVLRYEKLIEYHREPAPCKAVDILNLISLS